MGRWGICWSSPTLLFVLLACAFFMKHMSTNIFNIGKVNAINNNDITINTSSANVAEVVRAFMNGNAEDVQAEEVTTEQEQTADGLCPYIQVDKLNEMGVYTPEQFNQLLSEKTQLPAPDLAEFLHKHKKSGYLNYGKHSKRQVYDTLHAYFPKMRQYSYPNFCLYF